MSIPGARGVSAAVMNRMNLSTKRHLQPSVLDDVTNTTGSRRSLGGINRQSQDATHGYTTPAKKRAAPQQGNSLSTKKGFRPPVPMKTPPAKSIITPLKSAVSPMTQIQLETNTLTVHQPQQQQQPQKKNELLIAMPFHEMMRVSYKLLVSTSGFDSYQTESHERAVLLARVDATTALGVVFSAVDDSIFSFAADNESSLPSGAESMDDIFDDMKQRNYFGGDKAVTVEWFRNQFRLIVWKLATMEQQVPRFLFGRYLTKSQVMYQLCRRYQRDVVLAQRSILKKILHRDANSASCMVLRVAAVLPFPLDEEKDLEIVPPPYWKLAIVLTDGWHSIYATPDSSLAEAFWKFHKADRLVGMKIVTWSASLHNVSDGIDPLECALSTEPEWTNPLSAGKDDLSKWPYLKLPFNSTRPANATSRFGLEPLVRSSPVTDSGSNRRARPRSDAPYEFVLLKSIPLRSVEVGGGIVRSVRVRVTRVSPILHLQPKDFTIGPRILCEEHMSHYFQARQDHLMNHKKSKNDDGGNDDDDDDGEMAMQQPHPVPFTKIEVICSHNEKSASGRAFALLTVWRPSEEMLSKLKEGDEYYVTSLSISWKVDYGAQGVFLRLGTTKGSGFEYIPPPSPTTTDDLGHQVNQYQRACVTIESLVDKHRDHIDTMPTDVKLFGDLCVVVLHVDEGGSPSRVNANGSIVRIDHVFVTDRSRRLMSLRVASTRVPRKPLGLKNGITTNSAIRSKTVEHVFQRGSKKLWTEGAVVCISGVEVSHYDQGLGLLDCELVESAQLVSMPSKKSLFYEDAQELRRLLAGHDDDAIQFMRDVTELKKHVERRILLLDFEPTQREDEDEGHDHVGYDGEDNEADHLTQELSHQPESDVLEWMSQAPLVVIDGRVVKLLPLPDEIQLQGAFHDATAIAYVKSVPNDDNDDDGVLHAVYLSQGTLLDLKALVVAGRKTTDHPHELTNNDFDSETDTIVIKFEAQWQTSERLLNSWKSWERNAGATFLAATSVAVVEAST